MAKTLSFNDLALLRWTAMSMNNVTKWTFRRRFVVSYGIFSDARDVAKLFSCERPGYDVLAVVSN